MKVIFALNHPAHYYLFKYIMRGLIDNEHEVKIVIRQKDILEEILISEGKEYTKINEKGGRRKNRFSIISKGIIELIVQDIELFKVVKEYEPDFLIGTDISITHVGKLRGIPSFVFNEDDYEINRMFCLSSYPFANYIVSPEYTSVGAYQGKKIQYNGIQKMAYLNPKYFKPNKSILEELGLKKNDLFFIIRLVSLTSGHDIEGKHIGINEALLRKIISALEVHGRVFITSEDKLPNDFGDYQICISPNKMHDLMYFASLFIGDSQSMCAEAGILGTPFIRFNDFVGKIEYLNDLENNYKLGWGINTNEPGKIFTIIDSLFDESDFKQKWQKKKKKLFKDKIDLTSFFIWFIENYPESVNMLNANPDYQLRFK